MLSYMLSQYARLPVPEVTLRSWLKQWLSEQESRCTDRSFSARFPWRETGLCQEYFLQRKLKIDGKQFLTGPRYQGGNINKPFIDIVGMDSDLNHTALELISKEWSQLRAQYVRILCQASPSRRVFLTSIYMPLLFLNPLNSMINLLLCKWRHTKILTGVVRPWVMPISIHGRQFANCLQAIW